jgi:hypothetical protein
MRTARNVVFVGLALALIACDIRPLPEDVTGDPTYFIVRQIRCETREAIIKSAIGWLTSDRNYEEGKVDAESRRIGFEFRDGRPVQQFDPKLFKGRVQAIIKLFFETGIAYNFILDMTENNNLSGDTNLLKLFKHGKGTLQISGVADRQRQNVRTFTVTDKFSGLIRTIPDDYCAGQIKEENFIYPITGKIGVAKVIQDFIRLALFANLGSANKDNPDKGPPTMVDAVEFTTTFSLSTGPKVVFTPLTQSAVQVADASVTGKIARIDKHKVTIGLAIAGTAVSQVGPLRSSLFGPLLTASGGSTEKAAAEAVNQALTLQIFKPTIVVTP